MKKSLLDAAEVIDSWRVVPRLLLFGYSWWVVYVVDKVLFWYMNIPAVEQKTVGDSGVVVGIVTAVTGMGGFVFKVYSGGGRNWDDQPDRSTTVIQQTETK